VTSSRRGDNLGLQLAHLGVEASQRVAAAYFVAALVLLVHVLGICCISHGMYIARDRRDP
jgi:hypothetical protein